MNCNQKSNAALTKEQQELVAKNHDLIYSYAHKRNLSIDEYYDVLASGLCKAAKYFDEDKGKFSTLAYSCMSCNLNDYWRDANKKAMIPESLIMSYDSADTMTDMNDRKYFIEAFSDYQSYEDMKYAIMVYDILNILEGKEKFVFVKLLNDVSRKDIAEQMGCTVQNLTSYIQNIREKVLEYLYCN